jgi:exodeoxyribonuclease V beta subunit
MEPFEANSFALTPGLRLLEASAGTGKTFALAQLVLRLLCETGLSLRQLLVVTFTEAAAAELRDRIGRRLQQALACLDDGARPAPDPTLAAWLEQARPQADRLRAPLLLALEELDTADITTLHGFCRRTLQRQALEAGQPPELQLDPDPAALVRQVAHDHWQQQVLPLPLHLLAGVQQQLKGPAALEPLLLALDGDPALRLDPLPDGLRGEAPLPSQLPALWDQRWQTFNQLWCAQGRALEGDLCAAAAQWRAQGAAATTPYSAKPRRDRCAELDTWIAAQPPGGDHAAVVAQPLLADYFHPGPFAKVARTCEASADPSLPQRPLLEAIGQLREGPAELVLLHGCHWGLAELQRRRHQAGRLGFGQLLAALDPQDPGRAALLQSVANRYGAVLVDEFQDTDPIQWRILLSAFDPARHRLVLVGDPKQAIYRFRGGELETYRRARSQAEARGGISQLGVNYRSSAALLSGLNRLMAPGLRRSDLAVPPVVPGLDQPPPVALQQTAPLQLLWLGGARPAGTRPPSRSTLEPLVAARVAAHTVGLLEQGVPAGDVCLLVGTHAQAEALRRELERCGVASRLVSRGDVFESQAAVALQRLLDALADPGRSGRLRLLAASPLLGWSAQQLVAATPQQWSALAGRLGQLADQWTRVGLLAVLADLLADRGLARLALGGRLLADLQQCAALVQERIHADQLGPAAAADWLRRLRLEPERMVPEAHQPHSDAADAAVAVVTVHRSKGLEYPVVICPYLWQAPGHERGPVRPGVRWHPRAGGDPHLDLHLHPHWGQGQRARQQQRLAELAERERLAYVALTRACQLLVLVWGPAAGQQGNPLHPWLFADTPPPDPDHDPYGARSDADWLQGLQQQITTRQLPISLVLPDPQGAAPDLLRRWQPAPVAGARPLALGPLPNRPLDGSWGRNSYTSWTRGSHGAAPAALEEGRETDALVNEPDAAPEPATDPGPTGVDRDGPLAGFPRGAQAGDCLHRILEQLDYQRPADQQADLVARELVRSGIDDSQLDLLLEGLERLRHTPLGGALGRLVLAQLVQGERLHEMAFDLPLGQVRAADLVPVFGGSYGASLAQLPIASRGFLTGSIDLVFRHQQRWWVLDWKSNWLGQRDGQGQPLHCGPADYTPAAMQALMEANHYPLQAHLYLVALHRYLRWRLPGYDPARHMGGYVYVFLRGVPGPTEADPVPGVFCAQPPLRRLLDLDRVLGGRG